MPPFAVARIPCSSGSIPGPRACRGDSARSREAASRAETAAAYGRFCREVIDVVAPLVPAVKPQAAFFEQLGPAGMTVLAEVIAYAQQNGLLVILDGKRNDIGSTATAYAQGMLGSGGQSPWGADALTVSPYLGDDSLQPFIDVACAASRRGLRAREDIEPRRQDAPGSCGRGAAALSPCGRLCRTAGGGDRRGLRLRRGRRSGRGHLSGPTCGTPGGNASHAVSRARLRQPRRHRPRRCRRLRCRRPRRGGEQLTGNHLRPRR